MEQQEGTNQEGTNQQPAAPVERVMHTKLVGVVMGSEDGEMRQQHIESLAEQLAKGPVKLTAYHERENPFHQNARKVFADEARRQPLGYIKRELADDIAAGEKLGWTYEVYAEQITGGGKGKSFGLNVRIVAKK